MLSFVVSAPQVVADRPHCGLVGNREVLLCDQDLLAVVEEHGLINLTRSLLAVSLHLKQHLPNPRPESYLQTLVNHVVTVGLLCIFTILLHLLLDLLLHVVLVEIRHPSERLD